MNLDIPIERKGDKFNFAGRVFCFQEAAKKIGVGGPTFR